VDNKTQGAWIIHHTRKLQGVATPDFDVLSFSGKCGLLLSGITATFQNVLPIQKVNAIATFNGISPRLELPAILDELERQRLIQRGQNSIEILGLSTFKVLDLTTTIFNEGSPTAEDHAVIAISEVVSSSPIIDTEIIQYTSDTFKIKDSDVKELVTKGSGIGFFDSELNSSGNRLIFNGNLFRSGDIGRVNKILGTLTTTESQSLVELNGVLERNGCISLTQAHTILTEPLFTKLQSIGLFDVNTIGNEFGSHHFVTRPAAFTKFTASIADDAFDLAKAFVTSLTYGMTKSGMGRGRIQQFTALMSKLIAGQWVGPATAIGNDYQALEKRGVVQLRAESGSMYSMRLLKREVGELALAVIKEGEAATQAVNRLPNFGSSQYTEPESNRSYVRKNVTEPLRRGVGNLLTELRTGGLNK
jgi:hypothetical protein